MQIIVYQCILIILSINFSIKSSNRDENFLSSLFNLKKPGVMYKTSFEDNKKYVEKSNIIEDIKELAQDLIFTTQGHNALTSFTSGLVGFFSFCSVPLSFQENHFSLGVLPSLLLQIYLSRHNCMTSYALYEKSSKKKDKLHLFIENFIKMNYATKKTLSTQDVETIHQHITTKIREKYPCLKKELYSSLLLTLKAGAVSLLSINTHMSLFDLLNIPISVFNMYLHIEDTFNKLHQKKHQEQFDKKLLDLLNQYKK